MIHRQITTTFSGGALDPRLLGRQDLKAYQNGAAELHNVIVMPFGGVTGRPGTRWLGELAAGEAAVRLCAFEFNTEQTYCLAFLDGEVQVWKDGVRQEIALQDGAGGGVVIEPGAGTVIGNAGTTGGNAFNGQASAGWQQAATAVAATLAVGKTFPTAKRIARAEVWPASDRGYVDNYSGAVTVQLRASPDAAAPADYAGGVLLGTLTLDDTTSGPQTIESADTAQAFRHVWVRLVHSGTASLHIAEVILYEALPATAPPWDAAALPGLYWTQSADTLLVVHPDHAPRKITRTAHTVWTIAPWAFVADETSGRRFSPHYKFADDATTLQASATTGTVTLTARRAKAGALLGWFTAAHVGVRFRLGNKEVEVTAVPVSPGPTATATVLETLADTNETTDWSEEAWSAARGWPSTCCFHQDRLVVGGSRDLPNRLWLSKSADLYSFDLGEADDDDAIELPILTDQVNAIRGVFPGRHLQVFTSGAEFILAGDPLSPASVHLDRQTRVGSRIDRTVMPIDVDGVTVFVGRDTGMPRQMVWTYEEEAYQAPDLALLSAHLVRSPREMVYDQARRLVHFVNADGSLATLTSYRTEEVAAWSSGEIALADVVSAAQVGGQTYLAVWCSGRTWLERFEDGLNLDHAVTGTAAEGQTAWSGARHLAGGIANLVADASYAGPATIDAGGQFTTPWAARSVTAGHLYERVIDPLPPALGGVPEAQAGQNWRLVQARFRVHETAVLHIEMVGQSYELMARTIDGSRYGDAPPLRSTTLQLYGIGWNDGSEEPKQWTIRQVIPLPMTVLAVEQEVLAVT